MMKARNIIPLLAFGLMATLWGCDIETSDNGDFDGMWHLETVDTLGHGSLDCKSKHLYWSFQMRFMQTNNTETAEMFIYRFNHSDDSLVITEPRVNDRDLGDTLVTDISPLAKYGINSTRESFYIERLKGRDMVLSNKWLRLVFRKF